MPSSDYNVAIIGAGPVGLFSALRLSNLGVSCVVLEAENELPEDLRASTFHPPTLDILEDAGIADRLIAQGRVCPTWQIRQHPDHDYVEFDLSVLSEDTRHPYRLQCEQSRLCKLLLKEVLERENIDVKFGYRLTDLTQDDTRVSLAFETSDGVETLEARYVIGADGSRSQVRQALNFPFEGLTYPETTILATTRFPFEEHLPNLSGINYVWKEGGTFSLLHLPDLWRCSLYPDADEDIEDALKPESIQRKLQEIVPNEDGYEVEDTRRYRIHMRIVDDYRNGRVILAGDAAHINSPSGGMGMNGGLHDAWFLTQALHEVDQGAPIERLDRYTRQRRPVAEEQILKQADANRKRMQERNPERRSEMFAQLKEKVSSRDTLHAHLLHSSMIAGWRQSMAID
ncbi:FAD-dependent oxidoreductase [Parvularcula marina]|uniref:FAD-dependent monooxygenase n=1 Tax=Parvularcula marina TaxID=2292771 RepID=A0A371RI37_9PROT|nr:NAD(P)/FAD-dependent oxidoreductase [Parvularcula marina]RFB05101.1 FAD-dependent monooxygenase [Parvularcula marina]